MIPALDDLLAAAVPVALPMRVRFRGLDVRETVIFRGATGWGEFGAFPEYPDAEAARWLRAGLEAAWGTWPELVRDVIDVNATVPAVAPEQVEGVLAGFDGCRTVKVKVAERGQSLADDLARVAQVRALVGPAVHLRVDANAAWTVTEAREALTRLAAYDLQYAEQPCAQVAELAELRLQLARDGVDVPIAADESVRRAEDPLRVAREGAADLVVVKVAPLGGVASALQIVAECGLPAVVSSAIDSSVGIAAGVALAAALPEFDYACGLGTIGLLAADVAAHPLTPRAGQLRLADAQAVVAADEQPGLVGRELTGERREWWLDRLARCHALLP